GLFFGNGSGQLLQSGAGTTGQILQSNGGTTPTFFTPNAATVEGWLGFTPMTNALSSSHIFVGNGSNVATDVAMSGDVGINNTGSTTIQANVVSNSKLAQMGGHTYKGNNTGSTANPIDVSNTQLTADLNLFSSSLQGLVPASGGGTTNFLRAD